MGERLAVKSLPQPLPRRGENRLAVSERTQSPFRGIKLSLTFAFTYKQKVFERSGVFLFESFDIRQDMLCYWREAGGSSLTQSFMALAEQRHKVPKLSKRVFRVFVKNFCDLTYGLLREIPNIFKPGIEPGSKISSVRYHRLCYHRLCYHHRYRCYHPPPRGSQERGCCHHRCHCHQGFRLRYRLRCSLGWG